MKIWYVYSPRWQEKVYIFKAKVLDKTYGWDFNPYVFLGKGKVTTNGVDFHEIELNVKRWQIDDRAQIFKTKSEALKEVANQVSWNQSFNGPYHYHIPVMSSAPTRLD